MPRINSAAIGLGILAGSLLFGTASVHAGGYYYQSRSFYVTPPIYANLPVFGQAPIFYYEPVITGPSPVAGYYAPLEGGGREYRFRSGRNGARVRFSQPWAN
jgi:hypothetical protein